METESSRSVRDVLWSPEKRVVTGMLVWLGLLALASAFVATPFRNETSSSGSIIYAHVMYFHGLLIGLVGLLSLISMDIFGNDHRGTLYQLVLWGTLGATVLSGVGGILNHMVSDVVPLWMQILSFFCLDEILISLSISLFARASKTRTTVTWLAAFSAFSMLFAAIMGHIAGWMLEFGDWPKAIVDGYAKLAGLTWQEWMANLITSHSHEMVVGVLAFLVALTVASFGVQRDTLSRWTRFGLWWTTVGIIATTFVYVVAGFSVAQPPTLFAHGVNGLAGDDLVTGVGVMFGGLITLVGLAQERLPERVLRWSAVAVNAFLFVTVVVTGYYIEFHETAYGMGNPHARLAANDAVFTWWHQDFAFFLLPAILGVLLAIYRLQVPQRTRQLATAGLVGGAFVAFLAGMDYIFGDPAIHGSAFVIASIGIFLVVVGLATAIMGLVVTPRPALQTKTSGVVHHQSTS